MCTTLETVCAKRDFYPVKVLHATLKKAEIVLCTTLETVCAKRDFYPLKVLCATLKKVKLVLCTTLETVYATLFAAFHAVEQLFFDYVLDYLA